MKGSFKQFFIKLRQKEIIKEVQKSNIINQDIAKEELPDEEPAKIKVSKKSSTTKKSTQKTDKGSTGNKTKSSDNTKSSNNTKTTTKNKTTTKTKTAPKKSTTGQSGKKSTKKNDKK